MRHFEPESGAKLGQYELLAPVAKGGMAQVWAARRQGSLGFRNVVAIKTILPGQIDDARLEQMFLQEGALAPRLNHPNVVKTHELGEHDGVLFLVMDWVDGEPLHVLTADAQDHGGLPLEISIYVMIQVLRGLHAAHELCDEDGKPLGLVHRDLSPQNIMVTPAGEVKLLDFGIAKATSVATSFTDAGEIKGKYAYVSPEQVGGQRVDRRSDVFAAGVLLYLLTTGRHPFKGQSAAETVKKICSVSALAPSRLNPDYPHALEAVLMRALQKPPDQRYASAEQMALALEQALTIGGHSASCARLGEYVTRLAGNRSAERRNRLRLAEDRLERNRAANSNPVLAAISQGSLKALSIERVGDEIVIHAEAEPSLDALALGLTKAFPAQPRRTRSLRALVWGAALLCSGVLVGMGARELVPAALSPAAQPVVESPVPVVTFESRRREQEPRSVPLRPSPNATASAPSPSSSEIKAAPKLGDVFEGRRRVSSQSTRQLNWSTRTGFASRSSGSARPMQ